MGICHSCKENETKSQIKSGCGHLVFVCKDCREDAPTIQHSKCITCKGGKTPDQWMNMGRDTTTDDTQIIPDDEYRCDYDGDEEEYQSFNMDFE